MGCSLVKSIFFLCGVIKRIVDHAPKCFLHTRTHRCVSLPKARKVISSSCSQFSPSQLFFERKCRSTRVK